MEGTTPEGHAIEGLSTSEENTQTEKTTTPEEATPEKLTTLEGFHHYLICEEKSPHTIEKYLRDTKAFLRFLDTRPLTKEELLTYKHSLTATYAITSINSMLTSLNRYLDYRGKGDCKVKHLKCQRSFFEPEDAQLTESSYKKMLTLAKSQGKTRLYLVMQTLSNTGIRISELSSITVEAVRRGTAQVSCKGKMRVIFIHKELKSLLLDYIKRCCLRTGPLFVTRGKRPLDRSNVWKELQALSRQAHIPLSCAHPHSFRHLFARSFYRIAKDIVRLADILGHSDIATTRRYTMITTGACQRQFSRLGLLML